MDQTFINWKFGCEFVLTLAFFPAAFLRCQVGSVEVEERSRLPVGEGTELVASDERLARWFRRLLCSGCRACPRHAHAVGSRVTRKLQVWPWEMATLVASGIAEIFWGRRRSKPPRYHWMMYSTDERGAEGIAQYIEKLRCSWRK